MQWAEFLATEAATHGLSPEQTAAFVECLKTENSVKSQAEVATELKIGILAFKKRMTEVYDKFAQSYPELATSNSRGKLEKLRAYLTAKYNGGQDAHPTIKEIHQNIPPAVPFEKFVGREAELQTLHQQLQTSRQVAIVAVAGMGGVGKTELATQYAKQHLQNYQGGVCWLSAQGIDVGIQILRFAELKFKLIAPDDWELTDRLRYCWQNWQLGEVLLVFDNVTDYKKQVQRNLPPESPRFKVLLITRLGFDRTLPQLRLDVLKPLAAMKLLKSLVDRERLKSEPWVARKICKFLGYLPLGLELVGRYLDTMPDLSLEKLLKRLEKKQLEHEAIAKANEDIFNLTPYIPHLEEIATHLPQYLSDEDLIGLFTDLSSFYKGQGLYQQAEPWLQQCVKIARNRLSLEHPGVAASLNNLALLYKVTGRYSEAEPMYQQALELSKRLLGDDHPDVAISLNNLAVLYKVTGRYSEAKPLYLQALAERKRLLGDNHPDVAISLNNLAAFYESTGQYSEAEPLHLQALKLNKRLLGDNHPNVATSLNNLAALYESMGRHSEAEPQHLQALAMRKRLLGDNHPDVAISLNNLAAVYKSTGRYSEAEPLYQQALELSKRLLGDNHLDVAISLKNLAELYDSTGRYSEAEPLYQQALTIYEQTLGVGHPDTMIVRGNYARFLREAYRYAIAPFKQITPN